VRDALVAIALYAEELPAPDRAIKPISVAIPGNAEVGTFDIILCRTRGDVCLMMLHPNHAKAGVLGPVRRGVVGMQIADHRFRLEAVESAQICDRILEGLTRLESFQVADVMAEEDVAPDRDGDCILQMAANREHRRKVASNADSQRCIPSCSSQNAGAASRKTNYGIVASAHDRAVVHQEMIRDIFQAHPGFAVRNCDWLIAAIAAGANERKRTLLH
jgi:hypothetical protein